MSTSAAGGEGYSVTTAVVRAAPCRCGLSSVLPRKAVDSEPPPSGGIRQDRQGRPDTTRTPVSGCRRSSRLADSPRGIAAPARGARRWFAPLPALPAALKFEQE